MAFRSINTGLWQIRRFQRLSPTAKLMYIYLLSHPRGNILGCFPFLPISAAGDLLISIQAAEDAVAELKACPIVASRSIPMVECGAGVICLPDHLAINPLRGPKMEAAAIKRLREIPFSERPFRVLLWAVDFFCRDLPGLRLEIERRLINGPKEAFTVPGFPYLPPAYPIESPIERDESAPAEPLGFNNSEDDDLDYEIKHRFEMFWSVFPVKTNRASAWKAWEKTFSGLEGEQVAALHQRIMEGVATWCNSSAWEAGYLPSAVNFLINRLYEQFPEG